MLMAQQQLVQQQQAQPQLMMASAPGQHLQLPAQAQLNSSAPQLSVSAAASASSHLLSGPCGMQQQMLPAPLPQQLPLLGATASCSFDYDVPQGWQASAQQPLVGAGDMAAVVATAVSGMSMPHTVLAGPFAAVATGGSGPQRGTDSMALMQLPAAAMAPACVAGDAAALAAQTQLYDQCYGKMLYDCSSYDCSSMVTAVSVQAPGTAATDGAVPLVCNDVCHWCARMCVTGVQ
jgi:hypothetical protein